MTGDDQLLQVTREKIKAERDAPSQEEAMKWDVYRIMQGRGLVDYLGTTEAISQDEALDVAKLMYDRSEGETLEVYLAEEGEGL